MIKRLMSVLKYISKGDFQTPLRYLSDEVSDHILSFNKKFQSLLTHNQSCSVIDEDWDFLIIMDACRYDTFREVNWLEGRLEKRYSAGGNSFEFMQQNFKNRQFHDTVYISTNPHSAKLENGSFHSHELLGNRNSGIPIPPSKVTEAAIQAANKYPNKRLIIHFMEPHYPYTDQYGLSLVKKYTSESYSGDLPLSWPMTALNSGKRNAPSLAESKKAYRENLKYGLESVEKLLNELDGKAVVTSDHGELFGERGYPIPIKMWGHEPGIHHKKLREVPWLVIESETRRTITSESPVEAELTGKEEVETRLQALGYT